jgi:RNA polymerase sigma factor (sigma-70 family)
MRILGAQALPAAAENEAEVTVSCPRPGPQQKVMDGEAAATLAKRLSRLCAALERLPHEQHEIVNLRYRENLSFREIGERVHLTERQVRTRHENALETLTRELVGAASVSRSTGSA